MHPPYPVRHSNFLQAFGRLMLRLCGWRLEGALPPLPKFVVIVAPHTSNWDFPLGVFAMLALDLRGNWIGKHTLFRPPLGWLMRALGGEPVDRGAPGDVVEQVAARIRRADAYVLGISPEGTRRAGHWKTGFHRIARAAGVPVVPAWIDYARREVGIGAPVTLTDDLESDLARLGALFDARMARYPAQYLGPAPRGRIA